MRAAPPVFAVTSAGAEVERTIKCCSPPSALTQCSSPTCATLPPPNPAYRGCDVKTTRSPSGDQSTPDRYADSRVSCTGAAEPSARAFQRKPPVLSDQVTKAI